MPKPVFLKKCLRHIIAPKTPQNQNKTNTNALSFIKMFLKVCLYSHILCVEGLKSFTHIAKYTKIIAYRKNIGLSSIVFLI